MRDLRSRLLAFLDEELALCGTATPGWAVSGYERTLRALREEVERHNGDRFAAPNEVPTFCDNCGSLNEWPCDFLTRVGAALEISEDRSSIEERFDGDSSN